MNLGLKLIVESPSNPRKKFNAQKHSELTANVRLHGVLQALLVRPRWCVGVSTRTELERLQGRGDLQASPFEIVAGARRFRAATAAELAAVPCTVRFFTDAEAFDIQLIENLQRDDLTPIEEAQGYHDALDLQIDGLPVHTVASLAERVNKATDHIHRMLPLVRLDQELREAVETGILPVRQASLIARVPDAAARSEFGRQVLNGHGAAMPLTVKETEELRARDFMRELKGAPFNQEEPSLCALTIAGSPDFERWSGRCSDCPYRSGNIPGFEGTRGDICTNPECFTLKASAAFDRIAREAEAEGKTVMRTGDAARHFDALGELVFTTTLARLGEKPREDQLKAEVKRAPTWAALRESAIESGLTVPIYVTRNPKTGIVEELIDTAPLIAAAKKIGEPIFRGGIEDEPMFTPRRSGEDDDDAMRRGQREANERQEAKAVSDAAATRERRALAILAFKAVLDRLTDTIPGWDSTYDALVPSFVDAAGRPGLRFVIEVFGLKPGEGDFAEADCVTTWLRSLGASRRFASCLTLLVAGPVALEGVKALEFAALATALGVNPAKVVTKAKPAPKQKIKPKPAKSAKKSAAKAGRKSR